MAVGPNYQRQGVGSMLMKTFRDYIDENALDACFILTCGYSVILQVRIQGSRCC
jgi:ribosomal protein S18 acetylase RimI-like enzyme